MVAHPRGRCMLGGMRGVHVDDVDACMGKKVTSSFVRFPLTEERGTIVLGTGLSVIHL